MMQSFVRKKEAALYGIESALDALEIARKEGEIDFARYLQLKEKYETRKARLKQERDYGPATNAAHQDRGDAAVGP